MEFLINTYKNTGNLHHAYVLEGDRTLLAPDLYTFIEDELGIATLANPDFWYGKFDTFGIDDARKFKEMQNKKSISDGRRIFILAPQIMTREAQNSLLKIFEEPTANTYFFLLVPSSDVLLPTLKSRVMIIPCHNTFVEQRNNALEFLTANQSMRLSIVDKRMQKKKREDISHTADEIALLNNIESLLRDKISLQEMTVENVAVFEEVHKCREYLYGRGCSVKGILEHLSLLLPRIK